MRLFIFARHAESCANVTHSLSSDPAKPIDLTPRGVRQARFLGQQLANLAIEEAVCSRFLRTRRTIEVALGNVHIRVDRDLDEIDAGSLDGASIEEYRTWTTHHAPSEQLPGGESQNETARRLCSGFRRLLYGEDRVTVVVCHAGAIRTLLEAAGRAPRGEIHNATPYLFDETALRRSLAHLEASIRLEAA
jgi:phosphoserine phosphatase